MQVSVNSWHYKFLENKLPRYASPPANLCPYMRLLCWKMFTTTCFVGGLTILGLFLTAWLVAPLLYLANMVVNFLPDAWLVAPKEGEGLGYFLFSCVVGTLMYVLALCIGLIFASKEAKERYLASKYYSRRMLKKYGIAAEPKPPSVFAEWIRNIHDKTCSRIEFVGVPENAEASDHRNDYY